MGAQREIQVVRLGRVEYEDGLRLQQLFLQARKEKLVPDTLLLLEHPPVLTLGRAAKRSNVLASDAVLQRIGVELHETDRGGDVTYHGPGQLVGYPIFDLSPDRQDVRKYVRAVEESVIRALAAFGIQTGRIPEWPGVWIGSKGDPEARKIAAIGVHISRWLTTHGFALNLRPNLQHFGLIIPCGIKEAGVTSMALELGERAPDFESLQDTVARCFGEVFEAKIVENTERLRTVNVVVTDSEKRILLLRRTPERGGFWQTVTGRIEAGESPLEAARREVKEETGCELEVEPLGYVHQFALGDSVPPRLVEESAFLARWPTHARLSRSLEHAADAWVSLSESEKTLPFKGLRRAVALAAAR